MKRRFCAAIIFSLLFLCLTSILSIFLAKKIFVSNRRENFFVAWKHFSFLFLQFKFSLFFIEIFNEKRRERRSSRSLFVFFSTENDRKEREKFNAPLFWELFCVKNHRFSRWKPTASNGIKSSLCYNRSSIHYFFSGSISERSLDSLWVSLLVAFSICFIENRKSKKIMFFFDRHQNNAAWSNIYVEWRKTQCFCWSIWGCADRADTLRVFWTYRELKYWSLSTELGKSSIFLFVFYLSKKLHFNGGLDDFINGNVMKSFGQNEKSTEW